MEDVGALLVAARQWRSAGRPDMALDAATRAAAMAPDLFAAQLEVGLALLALGRWVEALDAAARAAYLAPQHPDAQLLVARANYTAAFRVLDEPGPQEQRNERRHDHLTRALRAITTGIAAAPGSSLLLYWKVRIDIAFGALDEAKRTAAAMPGDDVQLARAADLELALAYRDHARAEQIAASLLADDPSDPYAHSAMAAIAGRTGRHVDEVGHLVDTARAGGLRTGQHLAPRVNRLVSTPATVHLVAAVIVAFIGVPVVERDLAADVLVVATVIGLYAVGAVIVRRRQSALLAPLARAGRSDARRYLARHALSLLAAAGLVGLVVYAASAPVDRERAVTVLTDERCEQAEPPCLAPGEVVAPGATVRLYDGDRIIIPSNSRVFAASAERLPIAPPRIADAEVDRLLRRWRYGTTMAIVGVIAVAANALLAAVDARRARL